ncbi:hypothetical protein AXI76_gp100 [Pseudoalteromonas phage H101]|uniref:Uncharacterized protein n=1 Tax=Pseudoalteromonas phage H101 TaxID=1654919 RepID=A0A0H4IT02_9CAUD|nr:hypothetical protein AXI76_gp100 [Pseudoalteromonas phage H101]AKO61001.1 hypothetical protein [Pseudoalteromonas phage H101]
MFLVTPDENIYWGVGRAYGIANGYEGVLCYHVVIEWGLYVDR